MLPVSRKTDGWTTHETRFRQKIFRNRLSDGAEQALFWHRSDPFCGLSRSPDLLILVAHDHFHTISCSLSAAGRPV